MFTANCTTLTRKKLPCETLPKIEASRHFQRQTLNLSSHWLILVSTTKESQHFRQWCLDNNLILNIHNLIRSLCWWLMTQTRFYVQLVCFILRRKKNTKKQCLKHNRTSAHLSTDLCLCPFVNVCFHFIKVSFKINKYEHWWMSVLNTCSTCLTWSNNQNH